MPSVDSLVDFIDNATAWYLGFLLRLCKFPGCNGYLIENGEGQRENDVPMYKKPNTKFCFSCWFIMSSERERERVTQKEEEEESSYFLFSSLWFTRIADPNAPRPTCSIISYCSILDSMMMCVRLAIQLVQQFLLLSIFCSESDACRKLAYCSSSSQEVF